MSPDGPFASLVGPTGSPVTLWAEDCVDGLRTRVPAGSADVVVTSPPYNRKVAYRSYRDDRPTHEYLEWIGRVTESVSAALSPNGSFFLNVGGSPSEPTAPWAVARTVEKRFVLQNVIHWVKSISIARDDVGAAAGLTRDLAVGHYKPVQGSRYLHGAHEYIFHFTRDGDVSLDRRAAGVAYQDASNVGRWKGAGAGLRCRGNTWFLPYETIQRRATDRPHPASFPVALPERCLKLHGVGRTRLAADPFTGIGASAVAAARLGVPFVGFDVDSEYLTVARRRVEAESSRGKPVVASPTSSPRGRRARNPSRK